MSNRHREYSPKVVSLALMEIISEEGKNDFERFLIQQNIIQYFLMALIIVRTNLLDKNFLSWVENRTIGNLIHLYKIRAGKREKLLIQLLNEYNEKRVYLVHKIMKNPNYKQVKINIKVANDMGKRIIKRLNRLVIKKSEDKLRKLKKGGESK